MKKTVALTRIVEGHHNVIVDELLALLHNCLKTCVRTIFIDEIVEASNLEYFPGPLSDLHQIVEHRSSDVEDESQTALSTGFIANSQLGPVESCLAVTAE